MKQSFERINPSNPTEAGQWPEVLRAPKTAAWRVQHSMAGTLRETHRLFRIVF